MSNSAEPVLTSFSDTAVAFASKSNAELKRMYYLFGLMNYPVLVNTGTRLITHMLRCSVTRPLMRYLLRQTLFRQFCGGETIQDCQPAIRQLARHGVGTILDYSVEGEKSEAAFEYTTREILQTIRFAASHPTEVPFAVFKLTGIAPFTLLEKVSANQPLTQHEQAQWQAVYGRVERICLAAYQQQVRVFIDAEETWIQPAIDQLAYDMMKRFNQQRAIVYNTFQLYRRDGLVLLQAAFQMAKQAGVWLGAKLVRGAYMEKERQRARMFGYADPIQVDKASCDHDYNQAIRFCLAHIDQIAFCAGTHNEESCHLLTEWMTEQQLLPGDERVWFAQLYGMGDHISFNLAQAGFRVAKYVPYGPVEAVVPYLIRRAEENTSVRGQSNREFRLIKQELERRRVAAQA